MSERNPEKDPSRGEKKPRESSDRTVRKLGELAVKGDSTRRKLGETAMKGDPRGR